MSEDQLLAEVRECLDVDAEAFLRRVDEEVDVILDGIDEGVFDNPQAIVGFEYEFYAVEDGDSSESRTAADGVPALKRVPRRLLEYVGFEKELGLHNAEMSTSPQPLNADGLRAQEAEILAKLRTARDCLAAEGLRLVSDGLWTVPPVGESAREYLTDSVEVDGVEVAANMSAAPRYHAMGQPGSVGHPRCTVDGSHVHVDGETVLGESLITSIQPHYQVPQAVDLPTYFRYALRVAAPLLALGANSPLFPPDLYDDVPAETVVEDAHMASRIDVFESVLNGEDRRKVRFPRDVDSAEQAVRRVAEDDPIVPMPVEETDRFDDAFAAWRLKHGTFWRWVRPVFEGATRSAAHARIEFRPVGGQPTVRDSIAFQAAFAGLMESLPRRGHPVEHLEWERARENFYAAARDGLQADLAWIDADGDRVDGGYEELLAHAKDGLRARGLSDEEAAMYLSPLRKRVRHDRTPARWKLRRVGDRVEAGADLATAVEETQRAYVDRQRDTLLSGSFADWIDEDRYRVE